MPELQPYSPEMTCRFRINDTNSDIKYTDLARSKIFYSLIFIFGSFVAGAVVTLLAFRIHDHYKQAASDLVVKNLIHELGVTRDALASREKDVALLSSDKTLLEVRLESDKIRYEEQLALLKQARESFKNLKI